MLSPIQIAALALLISVVVPLRGDPVIIPLWPEGIPDAKAEAPHEKLVDTRLSSVATPTLTYFAPDASLNCKTAIIVCPGGAYSHLSFEYEGTAYRTPLNALGVHVFVLKYRLNEYGHPAPLRDALRAIRIVRSRANEWGIDADKIGIMGFSAGGHLAACASTLYDAPEGKTGAELDHTSARPDFSILLYPVITMEDPFVHKGSRNSLLGKNPSEELVKRLSVNLQVSKKTPPTFIVHTEEDKTVPIENSLLYYQALRDSGVPVEMHLFEKGSHGFSLKPGFGPTSEWPKRLVEWLTFQKFIPEPNSVK